MKPLPNFKDMAKLFFVKLCLTLVAYIIVLITTMSVLALSLTWNFPREFSYALVSTAAILGGVIIAFLMFGLDKHD